MTRYLLFGKWDTSGIQVKDMGLQKYINLRPIIVPRTSGRYAQQRFYKNNESIVERLMNKMMVPGHRGRKHTLTSGHCGGKSVTNYNSVKKVLEKIEAQTKQNPVAVLVGAIENAAPRDEITTIEYGGAVYPQAVDCSPQRRIDLVLRLFVQGSYQKSFGKKTKIVDALADEIILASKNDQKSAAVAKKIELERQADAAR